MYAEHTSNVSTACTAASGGIHLDILRNVTVNHGHIKFSLQNIKKDYKKYAYMFEQKDRTIRTKASKV